MLTLIGANGTGTRLSLPVLVTTGAVAIVSGNETVLELGDVTAAGLLSVTGCWAASAGAVTFHVDETKVGSGLVLAKLEAALCQNVDGPSFRAVSASGAELSRRYRLVYRDGIVRILPQGCCIYIR